MLNAPITLEYLLHCLMVREPHPLIHIQAWQDSRDYLVNHQMIEVHTKHQNFYEYIFKTTKKGAFFIDHLMGIPFPVEHTSFIIPERQVM